MRHKRIVLAAALACQFGMASVACASETINYSYDAKARLIQVQHSGSVNDSVVTSFTLDAADNRTDVTVTGARAHFFVVPLNGLTVIPAAS